MNEICKIFGYGYGADTSQVTKYSYGGPVDGELTGEITGSGARSITIEDINKKAGIYEDKTDGQMKYSDGTAVNSSYGNTENPTLNVYYPIINNDSGKEKSDSEEVEKFKYTFYAYNKSKIENVAVQNMLFMNETYWLASRCINTKSNTVDFDARITFVSGVGATPLCGGNSSYLGENKNPTIAVRPVVTLKSDVIDISTNYDSENGWKLK